MDTLIFEAEEEVIHKDESTLFSIYPCLISEFKPGLYPGRFVIEACADERQPSRLVINQCFTLVTIPDKPTIRSEEKSYKVAKAIVRDFYDSMPEISNETMARPGLTCLSGNVSTQDFLTKHKKVHDGLISRQNEWFLNLVKRTDNDWNRYHNHKMVDPKAIFGAKRLGLTPDKHPWLMDAESIMEEPKCPVCANAVIREAAICTTCANAGLSVILNKAKYDDLVKKGIIKVA